MTEATPTKKTTAPSNANTPTGTFAPMEKTVENFPTAQRTPHPAIPDQSKAQKIDALSVPVAVQKPSNSSNGVQVVERTNPDSSSLPTPTSRDPNEEVRLTWADLDDLKTTFTNIGARLRALETQTPIASTPPQNSPPQASPQQPVQNLTAPPGDLGNAGPMGYGAPTQAQPIGSDSMKLLEFLKPFLTPEQPAQGGSLGSLGNQFVEATIKNAIEDMNDNRKLMSALVRRVVQKEGETLFKLPAEKTRIVHTIADRPS